MRLLRWAGRIWIGILCLTVLLIGLLLVVRLLLPLPFLSPRPTLAQAAPADGAVGVPPRSRITLRFDVPMNPRSVERALRIDPPIPAALLWSDDRRTLTISPTHTLRPEATYHVTIGAGALSRMFRPPQQTVALSFQTAPAPAVLAVLPPDGAADVPFDTPISVRFSRTIVPTTSVALPTQLPELQFDPPLDGYVTWIDQATALFRPTAPLRPGRRYRATLAAGLTDLSGGELGSTFSWSFGTPPPQVLAVTPAAGERWVAPRAPLALKLSQSLDPATIQASLVITPSNSGILTAVTLPDATQWITFTPSADWRPSTTYVVALRTGPLAGGTAAPEALRWSFTAAPRPVVIGRFPGEGQTLLAGQDIRLIFNTPMDVAALRDALTIAPPAGTVRVTVSDAEARIAADLRPATVYTITLPASLVDRNGVTFGRAYQMRLLTAPAGPALELPDAPAHIIQLLPAPATSLLIRRTNLSALNLDLYRLDEATTVRALAFREPDWPNFQPERYGQALLRSWSMPLSDTLNTMVEDRLPLSLANEQPLPPGVYYLRIRTLEGPRADLLVLVSRVRLALQASSSGLSIWATDVISATPVGGQPLVLYQDGALIQRGTTGPNGLWQIARAGDESSVYVALTASDQPGIASSSFWNARAALAAEGYRVWLTTDRAAYRTGERVAFAGFVRRAAGRSNLLPPPGLTVLLTARPLGTPDPFYHQTLTVANTGLISGEFVLPIDAPAGEYVLAATIDDAIVHTTFVVRPEDIQPLDVAVGVPDQLFGGDDLPVTIAVHTPEGAPVAGAAISWTLSIEQLPFPARGDYTFGDAEHISDRLDARSGLGQTDAGGRLSILIRGIAAGDTPLRYWLSARAVEPGGPSADSEGVFLALPARVYAGLRLPSRILYAGQPGAIELLTLTPKGQPAPHAAVDVVVYRRTWAQAQERGPDGENRTILRPDDDPVWTQTGATAADGTRRLSLTLREGGEYRVLVSATDADGRRMASATTLWVAEPSFTGWRAKPDGHVPLVADRSLYRPGDTATLLLAAPLPDTTALVTTVREDGLTGSVRAIRAGEPITLALTAEDAPAVRVAVLLASRATRGPADTPVPPLALATTTLPVLAADRAISVTIVADRATYQPGARATFVITTTDSRGAAVSADLILGLVGAAAAPYHDPQATFHAVAPPALATALLPSAPASPIAAPAPLPLPLAPPAPAPQPASGVYWNPALHTGAGGVLTLTVQLPSQSADLRALAWAASGADRFGQAQAALTVTQPLVLRAEPPSFLRPGDEVMLAARVRNTSVLSQAVAISLTAAGVDVRSEPPTQPLVLGPRADYSLTWRVLVNAATHAALSFNLTGSDSLPQVARFDRPILPVPQPIEGENRPPLSDGVGMLREYLDPGGGQFVDLANLRPGQLVRVRLTVVVTEMRDLIALDEYLPSGCAVVGIGAGAALEQISHDLDHLTLLGTALPPGSYEYSYLLRAVTPGRYAAPAPVARSVGSRFVAGGLLVGVGNAARLTIIAPS